MPPGKRPPEKPGAKGGPAGKKAPPGKPAGKAGPLAASKPRPGVPKPAPQ